MRLSPPHATASAIRLFCRFYSAQPSRTTNISAVPVVDFSGFIGAGATTATRSAVATDIFNAFRDIGFVSLVNHGIPPSLISSTFASSALFFSLPDSVKEKYNWVSATSNRGYLGMGKEKLAYGKADLKETFEIGNDAEVPDNGPWSDWAFVTTLFRASRGCWSACAVGRVVVVAGVQRATCVGDADHNMSRRSPTCLC